MQPGDSSLIDTWYSRTLAMRSVQAASGSLSTDTCIVGAGLAGLTCALELARAGQRVIVLEACEVGWGASGRNGGFVSPGYAQGYEAIVARAGRDEALALYGLSIEGMRLVGTNIRELKIEAANPVQGILSVCRYPAARQLLAKRDWLAEKFDYPVDYLDRQDLAEKLASCRYHDAVHDRQAFHFNPLAYSQGLADAVVGLGGELYEHSPVHHVNGGQGGWRIETGKASISAQNLVIATGGYTGSLSPELRRSYLPIATYVMLSEKNPELVAQAVRTSSAIFDDRRASDYYRVVDDGQRLLWGGRITTRVSEPSDLAAILRRTMVATYPQLAPLQVDTAWSGLMSYARHRMPQIGRLPSGLWYCTAFGGHGMNTTAIGGRLMAEAITGQSDRYRHFAPFGLDYTGGPVGRVAVQATYWSYQLMDWCRERQTH
jgi:glycine/D-amino acid oxidase-like deaminating enzyme